MFSTVQKGKVSTLKFRKNQHFLSRLGYKDKLTDHGWRRVVVTGGQEIGGFDRDIIQRQIGERGHKQGAIGVYDRTQFLDQRRELMNWWTKELVTQGMEI